MSLWQIKEAKNRLSELIGAANSGGAQIITRHGRECAVVLSIEEYRSLTGKKLDFKEYLLSGPKFDELVIPRDRSRGRTVRL